MAKEIFKMPRMKKAEYDRIIEEEYICRIAFKGKKHPYIAPFLYVFDGRFMYFLSTNYGKKVQYFRENPLVVVEVERYSRDLSYFAFVALPGRLVEIEDSNQKRAIREMFVNLLISKNLSANVMSALGHSPKEPVEALMSENRNSVWKLESVRADEILGLKSHQL